MPSPQSKNWVFTINSPTDEDSQKLQDVEVNFVIWQYEQGTNLHIQGYLQAKRKLTLRGIKNLLIPRAHYEIARGTPEENIQYCTKPDTRVRPGGRRGVPTRMGQRSDLLSFNDAIKSGAIDASLINDHLNEFYKYYRAIDRVRMAFRPARNWEMVVKVFYGQSGSGKTRRAFEEAGESNYFVSKGDSNQITWWDGYHGQDSVIIDDFYGWLPWSFMLRLLDRYPFTVQIKGGTVPFTSKTIYITSNEHPRHWYKNAPNGNDLTPLLRRITEINEMNIV